MTKITQRNKNSGPCSVIILSKQENTQDKQKADRLPTNRLSEPSSVMGSDGTTYKIPDVSIKLNDPWPRNACKFPLFGNIVPADQPLFCGEPIARDQYCEKHYAITHTRYHARNDNARAA